MNSETKIEKRLNATFLDIVCLEKEETIQQETYFNRLINEATDSAFSSLLDNVNKQALYHTLSTRFGISKKNISSNIEGFSNALEQIFGQGAYLLEACIIRALHNKMPIIKIFPVHGKVSFTEYVESFCKFFSCIFFQ